MKPELYSYTFRSSELHKSPASIVSGFCSSSSHAIKNNCWSLGTLRRFKYKPVSRCVSAKRSDVWVDSCVTLVNQHMTELAWGLGEDPQMEDDIWESGTVDPPEKLSTPPPTLPSGYISVCMHMHALSHAHTHTDLNSPAGQ